MFAQDQNLLKAEYFERKAKQVHGAAKRTRLLATAQKYRDLAKTSPVEGDDEVRPLVELKRGVPTVAPLANNAPASFLFGRVGPPKREKPAEPGPLTKEP
jgi:hypothetical protein